MAKTDIENTSPENRQISLENVATMSRTNFENNTSENRQISREIVAENTTSLNNQSAIKLTIQSNIPDGVPTPFIKLLHWPETTRTEKKCKLPSVASSEQLQEYHRPVFSTFLMTPPP